MGFIIQTKENKIIVIDGGWWVDEESLSRLIYQVSGQSTVHAWFITHQHPDHIGAVAAALSRLAGNPTAPGRPNDAPTLQIVSLYANILSEEALQQYAPHEMTLVREMFSQNPTGATTCVAITREFLANAAKAGIITARTSLADKFQFDEVTIRVLSKPIDEDEMHLYTGGLVNDNSVVLGVSAGDWLRSALFLGDLGVKGMARLHSTHGDDVDRALGSRWLQLAHHGNSDDDPFVEQFYRSFKWDKPLWPLDSIDFRQPPAEVTKPIIRSIMTDRFGSDAGWDDYVAGYRPNWYTSIPINS
jgi:hypothetical protein